MEQRFNSFTFLIMNIARYVQKIKNAEMSLLGLKGGQVQCLFQLYQSECGASLTSLCKICGEDKGKMSRTLKELMERGLVYAEERQGQKYRNPFKLTEQGNEIAKVISSKISEMLNLGSMGITEQERKQLYRTLTLISDNLSEICNRYEE